MSDNSRKLLELLEQMQVNCMKADYLAEKIKQELGLRLNPDWSLREKSTRDGNDSMRTLPETVPPQDNG